MAIARRGFTLVELLVVIGIIVLLIGILLPVVSKAMRQANRTRIASDLNAISAALEAYKGDFGDYPRIIYGNPAVSLPYQGTGSGAALLGKALLGLGDVSTGSFNNSVPYSAGQIVNVSPGTGTIDFEATTSVPTGNTPAYSSVFWAPIPLTTAADGNNGPGFRIRSGSGRVYGPYLAPDKFRTLGLAIIDSFGNPILYYPANPSHPVITTKDTNAANYGPNSAASGTSNIYVGTAPGQMPNAPPAAFTGAPCVSLYNYSDNDTVALNMAIGAGSTAYIPTFPDISVMQAMLGDYSMQGYIAGGETPASTASFLLWSAGPDGQYGPCASNPTAAANFKTKANDPVTVMHLVTNCDDVTNFNFAP